MEPHPYQPAGYHSVAGSHGVMPLSSANRSAATVIITATAVSTAATVFPVLYLTLFAMAYRVEGLVLALVLAVLAGIGAFVLVVILAAAGLGRSDPGRIRAASWWGLAVVVVEMIVTKSWSSWQLAVTAVCAGLAVVAVVLAHRRIGRAVPQTP